LSIVVSDTSPIRALKHLGLLDLLEKLYGSVYVPDAVAAELRKANRLCGAIEVGDFPFLKVHAPKDQARVRMVSATLDDGEAAALVLAVEIAADFVLIDERLGRRVAEQMGLTPVGVLGVLAESKERKLIAAVRPLVERLEKELQFRMAPHLVALILRRVQE
jgi:uncharacterized protein